MTINTKKMQVLVVAGLLILAASFAQADTITAINSLVGNDSGSWSNISPAPAGPFANSLEPNGATVATMADTVTMAFSQAPGTCSVGSLCGAIYIADTSWNPYGFPPDATLLGSHFNGPYEASMGNTGNDLLTLTFTTPVSAFGILVQDVAYDQPFTATLSASFTGGCVGTCTFSNSIPSDPTGDAEFIGLSDSTGFNISSVTIDVPTGGTPEYYAVGPFTLTDPLGPGPSDTGTPEPGSLMLMASGLAAVAWKLRQRSRA